MKKENWSKEAFMEKGFVQDKFNSLKDIVLDAVGLNIDDAKADAHAIAERNVNNTQHTADDLVWEQAQDQMSEIHGSGRSKLSFVRPVYHTLKAVATMTVGNITVLALGALGAVGLLLYLFVMKVSVALAGVKNRKQNAA